MSDVKYNWEYCAHCDVMMVICPTCGNNCCNGGGNKCCSPAYKYQDIMYKAGQAPEKPSDWRERKEKSDNELKVMFQ